jgi:hypothetical protein
MFDLFFILGTIWFGLEIGRHLFTIYMAVQIDRHDRNCIDCQEQEIIREIRNK